MINHGDITKEDLINELRELQIENNSLKILYEKDINERKLAEKALQESEERFRSLYEHSTIGLYRTTPDGRILLANPALVRMLGYASFDDLATINLQQHGFYYGCPRAEFIEKIEKDGEVRGLESAWERKDGTIIFIRESAHAFRDSQARTLYYDGTVEDITERKQAEQALKESEEKYRGIFDESIAVVYVFDNKKHFINSNQAGLDLLGYSREELLRMSIADVDADPVVVLPAHEELLTGGRLINYEHKLRRKDGTIITVLNNSRPLTDLQGNISGMLSTLFDITARKHAEEDLKYKNEELVKLNAEKDKFFSIISHDLRSPLNSIVGFSKLLIGQVREKDYEGIEKYTGIILQSSVRAMDLLMNLMEWSRSQTGRMDFNPECFELVRMIHEVVQLFNDAACQKSLAISRMLPPNAPVCADKAMISTVLRNLISNAIKFTRPGGEIVISAMEKKDKVTVTITDTGVGIPAAMVEKLFRIDENFSTLGTQNEKGTGLGLILCKDFIEKHGGKIWVESEEGKGSSFYFTLPTTIKNGKRI